MNVLFFVLAVFYYLLASKVDYWITISLLGFKSECPAAFLRKEEIYHYAVWALFLSATAVGFFSTLPLWAFIAVMIVLWLLSGSRGHASAYKKYREIMYEFKEDADTPEKEAELDREIAKTDQELRDMALERAKW